MRMIQSENLAAGASALALGLGNAGSAEAPAAEPEARAQAAGLASFCVAKNAQLFTDDMDPDKAGNQGMTVRYVSPHRIHTTIDPINQARRMHERFPECDDVPMTAGVKFSVRYGGKSIARVSLPADSVNTGERWSRTVTTSRAIRAGRRVTGLYTRTARSPKTSKVGRDSMSASFVVN